MNKKKKEKKNKKKNKKQKKTTTTSKKKEKKKKKKKKNPWNGEAALSLASVRLGKAVLGWHDLAVSWLLDVPVTRTAYLNSQQRCPADCEMKGPSCYWGRKAMEIWTLIRGSRSCIL